MWFEVVLWPMVRGSSSDRGRCTLNVSVTNANVQEQGYRDLANFFAHGRKKRTGIRAHSLGGTLVCTGQLKRKDTQTPGQGVQLESPASIGFEKNHHERRRWPFPSAPGAAERGRTVYERHAGAVPTGTKTGKGVVVRDGARTV